MYALASNLIGFRSSTLRVRVIEQRDGYAWVRTADLQDAGTPLTLRAEQITPLDEGASALRYRDGLVTFAG